MLDDAGLQCCKIVASNALDEYLIRDLMMQDAKVDTFGVGERLITSKSTPVFGGVYKLVAVEDNDGNIVPKSKSVKTLQKSLTHTLRKFIDTMTKKVARLWQMNFVSMMK